MKLGRVTRLSLALLAAHKLRTLLSVAGIVVGVAAVILMVSVGRGAEASVLARIRAMGTDMVMVTAAPPRMQAGRERQGDVVASLLPGDVAALLAECGGVLRAAGAIEKSMSARFDANNITTLVQGLAPAGREIRGFSLQAGRFSDEDDERVRRRIAVIGPVVARNLFGSEDPIGQSIRLGPVPFEVVGLTRPRGADASGLDQDNIVLVPLETGLRRLFNVSYLRTIYLQAKDSDTLPALEADAREVLRRRRRLGDSQPDPFKILNQATLLASERDAGRAMTLLIGSVAAIALLVGGIGILAVMTMTVRERIREVGLRRALGARRRDILVQFLIEATIMASVGGVLGSLVGLVGTVAIAAAGVWSTAVSWPAVGIALVTSVGIGIVFGIHPARNAANLPPVVALRAG